MARIIYSALFYVFVFLISIAIFLSLVILGQSKYSEAGGKVKEQSKETFERISSIRVLQPEPEARLLSCTKEGALYRYKFNIQGLTVLHEATQKNEITISPVLSYKGVDVKPLDETIVTLKPGKEKTIWPDKGLDYEFTSVRAPTIFVQTLGRNDWEGVVEVNQPVIFKNFRVEVTNVRPLYFFFGTCKVYIEARCKDERLKPPGGLSECNSDDDTSCAENFNLCNTPLRIKFLGYENNRLPCELRKPKIQLIAENETKAMDLPDFVDIVFCSLPGSLPCDESNQITSYPVNLTPENYNTGNCLPTSKK